MTIEAEIEEVAELLYKSTQAPQHRLIDTVAALGAEGIRARWDTLNKAQKELLVETLEEIAKGKKAVAMDDEYQAEFVQGNVYKDSVIQEDKADDDQDEKLVKKEAATINHQGDVSPEGREGQIIKSEDSLDDDSDDENIEVQDDSEEDADEVKVEESEAAEEVVEKSTTTDFIELLNKSNDAMYKTLLKMCGTGKSKDEIVKACIAKGMDESKVSELIDGAMQEHNESMHKAKILAEEDQLSDTDDGVKGKSRAKKDKVAELDTASDSKAAQSYVDNYQIPSTMKKSVSFTDKDALLKANTLGRNHHFSVNSYYDSVLAKSKEVESEAAQGEDLAKSEDAPITIEDIIAKGGDHSLEDALNKSQLALHQIDSSRLVKSFSDDDMLKALGIDSEEELEAMEKGEKIVTRGGEKFYASGRHAGKKVGTVRGKGGKPETPGKPNAGNHDKLSLDEAKKKAEKVAPNKKVNERSNSEIAEARKIIQDSLPKPRFEMSWEEFKPYGVAIQKQSAWGQPDSFYERKAKFEWNWGKENPEKAKQMAY